VGGRNQEMLLAAAIAMLSHSADLLQDWEFCVAAAAFDGIEGNSPAAGAFLSNRILKNLPPLSDLKARLAAHDSHSVWSFAQTAITTGQTRTNVNDMTVILVRRR